MKTDLYTKTILTIIAVCLSINVFQQLEIIPSAHAAINPTEERFPVLNNVMDVRIVDVNTSDELSVNVKSIDAYDEMKVNITSIDTRDELDINIDEIGGSYISSGGPLKVKVTD